MNYPWKIGLALFFLYYFGTADSSECPEYVNQKCTCTSDMYDCANQGLKDILDKTEENVRTLDLSGNYISETKVIDASSLVYLSLANNQLRTLKYDTFDNLDELKTLILSKNHLNRVTDDIFEWNPLKLEVLKLDKNNIEFIQHFLFYDLEELTELDLSYNNITFIHPHAFTQLKKLRKLSLQNNHLHTFESKWFKGLKANMFTSINLNDNRWACDCTMKTHVSWLKMKKTRWFSRVLDSELQCQQPPDMVGTAVKDIADESKTKLQCDAPDITGISQSTELFVNQSIELDCVIDRTKFPVPVIMWIAPNKDHYNLQTADRFEGIEVFQNGSMIMHNVTMDDNGEYKCVATNNVSSVQASTTLTITVRKITDRKSEEQNRKYIHATEATANDTVINVRTSCPRNCTCVSQHVDCSSDDGQSGLNEIEYNSIPGNTVTLNLASNSINSIPYAPANKFGYLSELRLDNNQISNIDKGAFDNLGLLQTLTLRDNKISWLPDNLFKNLPKLTILVLDNNQLTTIDDGTLFGLSSLQWLYIRNNLIRSISLAAFAPIPKVRFIHMEHNELTTFPLKTVTTLTESKERSYVQKIFVDYNEFSCDCKMNHIKTYLEDNLQWNTLFGDGIRCSFPPELHDQYLQDVKGKLACNATTYKTILTISGNDGGKKCHFPFEFNNEQYNKCILVHGDVTFSERIWCATTYSFSRDGLWGVCPSEGQGSEYETVIVKKKDTSGSFSGIWFGGLIVGLILCVVLLFMWKRYRTKTAFASMKYSNLPRDDATEHQSLTSGNSGSEAFV